ncbi:hypothetical protein F1643_17405 [Azospirillum sp. INR13]|uniref:hypothetical protein n=1 Tax=Azospirillum sp. INR13 TaxID=2596919 RepID=UPI0018920F5E|nr:hypothetical protein [Azospirillum sp. INR13]MBF5095922.1 hypothetical protein [Azospirillum sp. INR13]
MSFREIEDGFNLNRPLFDRKFLQRKNFLVKVGESTARIFSRVIFRKHGLENSISFNSNSQFIDHIVCEYFSRVEKFRDENNFSEDHLINFSKIAAIMTTVLLDLDPITLFRMEPELQESAYAKLLVPYFSYQVVATILQLNVEKIEAMEERDLLYCFYHYADRKPSLEWIILMLRMLQKAYSEDLPTHYDKL